MPDDQQTPQQPESQNPFDSSQQSSPAPQPSQPQPFQPQAPYSQPTQIQDQGPSLTEADSSAVGAVESESFTPGTSAVSESSSLGDSSTLPPIQPLAPIGSGATPSFGAQPAKKNKKGLFIGLIIAIIIALLLAATAAAYKFWYQNPQKVVTDALVHAIEAKTVIYTGTISVDKSGNTFKLDVTGGQDDSTGKLDAKATIVAEGQTYTLNGSGLIDSHGDLYVRLQNLDSLATALKKQFTDPSESAAVSPLVDQLKAKIDGTWIKISNDDLKTFSDSYAKTKTCLTDAAKTLKDDSAASNELRDLYTKHQFISIDKSLGAKDGSLGYVISSNDAAMKAFTTGLEDTKIYKQLHSCDSSFTINPSDFNSSDTKDTSTTTVWISRWTHELTNVTVNDKSDGTTTNVSVTPTFNKPVTVTTPTKSTTLSQLESDIMSLIESVYMSAAASSYGATSTAL